MESDVNNTLFFITKDDAQSIATGLLGRRLTRFELKNVRESVEEGFKEWEGFLKMSILQAAGMKQKLSGQWNESPRFTLKL